MRKIILGTIIGVSMFAVSACGSKTVDITKDNVKNATVLMKNDGSVQSSLVEDFDKDYYDIDELKTFVQDDLKEFNSENNTNVEVKDVLSKKKKAYVILGYGSVDDFCTYSGATASVLSADEAKKSDLVDNQISKYGKKSKKDKSSAIKKKYKTVVIDNSESALSEKLEVSVEGEIKFTSNVSKVNENTVKCSSKDKVAVIVYEPY